MSWPPTLRHVLGLTDNPLRKCLCGRVTNADMLVDVRPLPEAVRGSAEFICDACCETLFRKKLTTRVAFYTAHAAPAAVLAKAAKLDAPDAA